MRRFGWVAIGALALCACGEDDPGPGSGGTDGGRDGAVRIDGGGMDGAQTPDSGTTPDGSSGGEDGATNEDSGGSSTDAGPCTVLSCTPPRDGCRFEGASCTSCGELRCGDVVTPCVECPLPGDCCSYDAPTCESCGEPICFTVDCAAPPPGCRLEGGSCRSCGTLVCEDGGAGGEPCGPVTCGAGMVCCNESCGICTPPGGGCIDLFCEDAGIPTVGCGARLGDTCARNEWCDFSDRGLCGAADATGVCRPRPEVCPDVFMPVCGCDGMTHGNACEAHAAGTDDARPGACETEPVPDECATVRCTAGTMCVVCRVGDRREARCLARGETCETP